MSKPSHRIVARDAGMRRVGSQEAQAVSTFLVTQYDTPTLASALVLRLRDNDPPGPELAGMVEVMFAGTAPHPHVAQALRDALHISQSYSANILVCALWERLVSEGRRPDAASLLVIIRGGKR